jgi:signal transduction histidine kinase
MDEQNTTQPRLDVELERQRLNSLINSMADGVIALDENGAVVVNNGEALNVLDLNNSMQGQTLSGLIKLLDKSNNPVDVGELVKSSSTAFSTRDYRLVYSDGSMINLYLSIAPVHLGFGKNEGQGHVLLLRDITREKSLEEERDDFVSVVSHELRNPVAIVEGNISTAQFIAEKDPDINKIKEALAQAHDQIIFLSGLIEDLATLSRAERGVLKIEPEEINARELVEELADNYRKDAEAKGLALHTQIDPSLELLRSSRLYVREVLQNFITNAIKYTETGSVTIGVRKQAGGVLFNVIDTGIGISQGDKAKVFDKFFRSDDTRTQRSKGTGLGLYVTAKLAKMLGADINLESELNKGSNFSIFIPNLNDPKPEETPVPAAA